MKDTKRSFLWLGVAAGWLMVSSINSLWQDSYGLEGYIALCREHWTDPKTSIPVAALMLSVAVTAVVWAHVRAGEKQ